VRVPIPHSNDNDSSHAAEPSFEDSLIELENVVHDLEDGRLGLTESLGRYEEGVKHLKRCYQLLEQAEQKIGLLTGVNDDGSACSEPFDGSSEPLAEAAGRRRRAKKPRPAAPDVGAASEPLP
jgi:exodeoxyribonuclease VII small subunit